MRASVLYSPLEFKRPAGTSRGILHLKHSWIFHLEQDGIIGKGECSIIPDLSPDFKDIESYAQRLNEVVELFNIGQLTPANFENQLRHEPSILFGVECAMLDLKNGGKGIYFNNDFSTGSRQIPINGLVWMGDETFMREQIETKINDGFTTIKMKIGAIDFETELSLLKSIRAHFGPDKITLRVDANGAFSPSSVQQYLNALADLSIHSIEQPIKAGQWKEMKTVCQQSPIDIALDEELIGIDELSQKIELLETIKPQFIILKPSLHGGIVGCKEWIDLAEKRNIPWWMTSALESNIGLKAICEFTAEYENDLPQGLGTGSLYVRNFESKLTVKQGHIYLEQ